MSRKRARSCSASASARCTSGASARGVGVHLLPFAFEGFQRGESLLLLLAQALGFLLQRLAEFGEGALALAQPIEFAQRALFGGQLALQHRARRVSITLSSCAMSRP
jgi:hypothetical protein